MFLKKETCKYYKSTLLNSAVVEQKKNCKMQIFVKTKQIKYTDQQNLGFWNNRNQVVGSSGWDKNSLPALPCGNWAYLSNMDR